MFGLNRAEQKTAPENDTFAQLQEQLAALASAAEQDESIAAESIADDTNLDEKARRAIERDEALVRRALELFGVVYDDLIRMDEQSPYAKALKMQPDLLTQIANAENPVLAALEVAVGFEPYADFIQKYGQDPAQIKESIRQEVEEELRKASKQRLAETSNNTETAPVFSTSRGQTSRPSGNKPVPLADIFKS